MESQNWTQFTRKILIDAPVKTIYDCWATQSGLQSWFLEKAPYFSPTGDVLPHDQRAVSGNQFSWKWHNWPFEEKGEVLEANDADRISFTFGDSIVRIRLTEQGKGTQLTLIQESIPLDDKSRMNVYVGCSNGWTFWLTNLKAWLEHGIVLHQKDPLPEPPDGMEWVNM